MCSVSCKGRRTWGCEPMTSWSSKMHLTSHERATACAAMATAFSTPLAAAHHLVRGLSQWARRRINLSGGNPFTYTYLQPVLKAKFYDQLLKQCTVYMQLFIFPICRLYCICNVPHSFHQKVFVLMIDLHCVAL